MAMTDIQIPTTQTSTPMSNDFSIDDILTQISAGQVGSADPGGQTQGGGMGSIPIMPPQKPVRTPPEDITMGARGSFRSRGEHKRATLQSLMGNITSIITKGIQNQQEKKARQVQFDMERIITILQSDPNIQNPQNQKILNDIAGDPKKLKAFQKALGIDFIKPDKNQNAPERKGAQAAFQGMGQQPNVTGNIPTGMGTGAGATIGPGGQPQSQSQPQIQPQTGQGGLSPQARALIGMFPQGPRQLQMSPEEKLQAEKIKAGLIASADKRLEALSKVIDTNMRAIAQLNVAQLNQLGRMQVAKILAESKLEDARMRVKGAKDVAGMKISAATQLENLKHTHRLEEIGKRHDLAVNEKNPEVQARMIKEASAMVDSEIKDLQLKLKSAKDTNLSDAEIKATKTQLEDLRNYRTTLTTQMAKTLSAKGVESGATSAAGLADTGAEELDDSAEENLLGP